MTTSRCKPIAGGRTYVHEVGAEGESAQEPLAALIMGIREHSVWSLSEATRNSSAGAAGMLCSRNLLRLRFILCEICVNPAPVGRNE
jgi:hypothetical protein